MMVNPANQRILAVTRMDEPEGNKVAMQTLRRILPHYQACNTFVLDRCCEAYPANHKEECFKQIKYWAVDEWHAHGHKKTCPCNTFGGFNFALSMSTPVQRSKIFLCSRQDPQRMLSDAALLQGIALRPDA